MKQFYQITFVIVFTITSLSVSANPLIDAEKDSVFLGAGYANDIYYSFENGQIHSIDRKNWDIAFYANILSAGIITNDGNGVKLYTYPNADTAGWNSMDTTGLSSWPVLYNSTDEWEEGAFNKHSFGGFDYGWGIYNIISHKVIGDSLHVIMYLDGEDEVCKKLWIEKKVSMQNTYYFKFADLDGTNEVIQVINCNDYSDKNFVYYSLLNETILDREPNADSWDILFTKYIAILEGGVPYGVTGAVNNIDIPANRFDEVNPDFEDWTVTPMDSTKSPIGHDWKYFDMNTFNYVVEDSIAFFVSNINKDVYKLVFSVFDYTDGKIVFSKSQIQTSLVREFSSEEMFSLYPNPATDVVRVNIDKENSWEMITITDLNGKVVYTREINQSGNISVSVDELNAGMYLIMLISKEINAVQRLIIQ